MANSAVELVTDKNNNFYAQRRQKRIEIMGSSVVKPDVKLEPAEKAAEYQNQKAIKEFGSAVIKRGKSLRQINRGFGYDRSDNW